MPIDFYCPFCSARTLSCRRPDGRSSVTLAIIFSWVMQQPEGWRAALAKKEDMLLLVLALFPVLDVMLAAPRRMLPGIVIATSVEQLKHTGDVKALHDPST